MSQDVKDMIDGYSIKELKEFIGHAGKAIEERKVQELNDARIHVRELAASLDVSLEDLIAEPTKTRKQSKKAEVKYRHRSDENLTWTGRGKRPKWLNQEVENGAKLEDFAV